MLGFIGKKACGVCSGITKDLVVAVQSAGSALAKSLGLFSAVSENGWQKIDPQLDEIFGRWAQKEESSGGEKGSNSYGAVFRGARLADVARLCASRNPGDFLEIGAYKGETTVFLAEMAKEIGRRVVVVDPWEAGTQNCSGEEFGQFCEKTGHVSDVIDIVRISSQIPEGIAAIKERQLCFSYIDGLHSYLGCLTDILSTAHTKGIIAVDDYTWNHHVRDAVARGSYRINRTPFHPDSFREAYLLPQK